MGDNRHTLQELYQYQSLSLESKIRMTIQRIQGWIDYYGEDGTAISFSGGKDSTVLMDIIRNRMGYKNIPAVFVDVPTQYPELKEFALTWDNVEVIYPKKSFVQVCKEYGFPLISKEVSESVYGARKYLTSILEQNSLERTNERTNERSRDTGIGTIELLEQEHTKRKSLQKRNWRICSISA